MGIYKPDFILLISIKMSQENKLNNLIEYLPNLSKKVPTDDSKFLFFFPPEIVDDKFLFGVSKKPSFNTDMRRCIYMKYIITGKNIDVTEGLKSAIEDKLDKLDRYFNKETEVIVTLNVEKGRQKIEVTIPVKGSMIRAEQTSEDMYASIEAVTNTLEAQLKKHRNKN